MAADSVQGPRFSETAINCRRFLELFLASGSPQSTTAHRGHQSRNVSQCVRTAIEELLAQLPPAAVSTDDAQPPSPLLIAKVSALKGAVLHAAKASVEAAQAALNAAHLTLEDAKAKEAAAKDKLPQSPPATGKAATVTRRTAAAKASKAKPTPATVTATATATVTAKPDAANPAPAADAGSPSESEEALLQAIAAAASNVQTAELALRRATRVRTAATADYKLCEELCREAAATDSERSQWLQPDHAL